MLKSVSFQLVSLVYLLLLAIVTWMKYRNSKKTLVNVIYQVLLFSTALVIIMDIITNIMMHDLTVYGDYVNYFGKAYLVTAIIWCMWLMIYVLKLNKELSYNSLWKMWQADYRVRLIMYISVVISIVTCIMPSEYIYNPETMSAYISGMALYFTFVVCFVYMGIMAIYIIANPHNINFKQRIPIFVFLLLGLLSIVIQWMNASLLLVSSVMAFVMLFIYFMMENPDLKIIDELEKEKEVVEESSKAKTDFLSNMSHDIRTPMNAIIGFAESLLMEDLNETQKDEVQNIYEAATTLLNIINNILDISRIESGKEEKKEAKYELRKVVMQLTSMVTGKLDPNVIKFNVNIDKDVPTFLIGDSLKLYQILMNLLSNAVKYTEKGHIDFTITSENVGNYAKLKFVVSDTGMGIKEEDFDKLFVKFSRIHNQENYKSIEGTGLGLVITKQLVLLLGGTITFESKYGVGTSFTVIIPQLICNDVEENIAISALKNPASVGNVHFDGSLYDILIVDDNNLNLKVAQRILSDYKFHITCISSGEECLERLQRGERYDLIFLDHMMPGIDGIETLHRIKQLQGVKIPPVVALTANAMVGMKELYLSEGFVGYISKPINREDLQVLLNNIFCQK